MRSPPPSSQQLLERALRREHERERLVAALPAGSPATALRVASAAVIEAKVAAMTCPHCAGSYRLLEHTRPRAPLRQLDVVCRHCGIERTLWFALIPAEIN